MNFICGQTVRYTVPPGKRSADWSLLRPGVIPSLQTVVKNRQLFFEGARNTNQTAASNSHTAWDRWSAPWVCYWVVSPDTHIYMDRVYRGIKHLISPIVGSVTVRTRPGEEAGREKWWKGGGEQVDPFRNEGQVLDLWNDWLGDWLPHFNWSHRSTRDHIIDEPETKQNWKYSMNNSSEESKKKVE